MIVDKLVLLDLLETLEHQHLFHLLWVIKLCDYYYNVDDSQPACMHENWHWYLFRSLKCNKHFLVMVLIPSNIFYHKQGIHYIEIYDIYHSACLHLFSMLRAKEIKDQSLSLSWEIEVTEVILEWEEPKDLMDCQDMLGQKEREGTE